MADMFYELAGEFFQTMKELGHSKINRRMTRDFQGKQGILHGLHHMGPCSAALLAKKFNVSSARMTKMLAQLEEEGLITRTPHPSDKRQSIVEISAAGEELLHGNMQRILQLTAQVFEGMGEKDARELVRLMSKMSEVMQEIQVGEDKQ